MPTRVKAINTSKLLVAIGDGDTPTETFTHPCMINSSRGIEFDSTQTETVIPYCPPDEDLPGWIEREMDSLTATISGAGILDAKKTAISDFWDWYSEGVSKNIHVIVDSTDTPSTVGYFKGAALLKSFNITGTARREKVTFDCTIMSDGEWDWVPAT